MARQARTVKDSFGADEPMQTMLLFNPAAGAGRAGQIARRLAQRLEHAGHDARLRETVAAPPRGWLDDDLEGIDVMLVIGGDGAMRLACGPASRTATPIYQIPGGTENLFAREFGQSGAWTALRPALDRFDVRWIDLGEANGEPFALMASVGYDAEVVYDLAARRGGAISQLTYLRPMVRQLLRFSPAPMTVTLDGEPIVRDRPGLVVVANSRHYAFGLNPAFQASMTDGRFDVLFFPAASAAAMVAWAVRCRCRRQMNHPQLVYRCGRSVVVESDAPQRYQLDGDPPRGAKSNGTGGRTRRLEMHVRGGKLPVLMGAVGPDVERAR